LAVHGSAAGAAFGRAGHIVALALVPPASASSCAGVTDTVAGAVAEMFGLKWQAMIQGLAFMSHQLGSFLAAY